MHILYLSGLENNRSTVVTLTMARNGEYDTELLLDKLFMNVDFSFSDMIAGYVMSHDVMTGWFSLETSDGRVLTARLTASTFARFSYNLDEKYQDTTHLLASLLGVRPQFVFVYGTYYPDG